MPAYPLTPPRRARVLAALTAIAGSAVRVISEQPIGHEWAPVTRLFLDHELDGIGSSVVVKTLDLPPARPARSDALHLFERAADPNGPAATLTHQDLNPGNVLITDTGARLVDFEGCRFGPAGIDAAFLHYPFPHHSKPWGLLPEPVVEAAGAAYRAALAHGGADPILHDYDRILADGAAITLIGRVSRLHLLAGSGQSPHDSWRRRGQVVQQIRAFVPLAERAGSLAKLTGWLRELEAAMTRRWADATDPPAPLFPAFAG